MKKSFVLTIVAFLAFGLTASVNAAPKAPQDVVVVNDASNPVLIEAKSYRYVGNSTTGVATPVIGINGMHETCQTDFGTSARMCTTTEVFETPNMPSGSTSSFGWVQPIISDVIINDGQVYYFIAGTVVSESATAGIGGANCLSWRTDNPFTQGTGVLTSGGVIAIADDTCDENHFVACCLPQ